MKLKNFFVFAIIFVILFSIGFSIQWRYLTERHQECIEHINQEIYTDYDRIDKEYYEAILEIYDNFSIESKLKTSVNGGLFWGCYGILIALYIYLLYKLLSSKNRTKIIIGWVLISITVIFIFLVYLFIANFQLVF